MSKSNEVLAYVLIAGLAGAVTVIFAAADEKMAKALREKRVEPDYVKEMAEKCAPQIGNKSLMVTVVSTENKSVTCVYQRPTKGIAIESREFHLEYKVPITKLPTVNAGITSGSVEKFNRGDLS